MKKDTKDEKEKKKIARREKKKKKEALLKSLVKRIELAELRALSKIHNHTTFSLYQLLNCKLKEVAFTLFGEGKKTSEVCKLLPELSPKTVGNYKKEYDSLNSSSK